MPADDMESPRDRSTPAPRLRSVLLGLFVLWQLFYLPVANYIKLLPVRLPPHRGELNDEIQLRAPPDAGGLAQGARDLLAGALGRWGELTGQTQGWALFAPTFGHQAVFPALGFGGAIHPSSFRPVDPQSYFRALRPSWRLGNYEQRLVLVYSRWTPDSYRESPDEWQQAIAQGVRWQRRPLLAYMRWRVDRQLRANPGAFAPPEVVLYAEAIPSPPPGSRVRSEPRLFPLLRWRPGTPSAPGHLLIEGAIGPGADWVPLPEED